MTDDIIGAVLGVIVIVNGFIIRILWRLQDRISRLEGRLNGHDGR